MRPYIVVDPSTRRRTVVWALTREGALAQAEPGSKWTVVAPLGTLLDMFGSTISPSPHSKRDKRS
jgi:hypothetical protein